MCVCFGDKREKEKKRDLLLDFHFANECTLISEGYSWSSSSSSSPLSSAPLSADAPAAALREFDLPAEAFESPRRELFMSNNSFCLNYLHPLHHFHHHLLHHSHPLSHLPHQILHHLGHQQLPRKKEEFSV